MSLPFDIRIDTQGTLERLRRELEAMPDGIARAQRRALRKLSKWMQSQILKEVAAATGATQKTLKALVRYKTTLREDSLMIWIGTNPLKAHWLGKVKWTRRMAGARAGRRGYPGTWSWSSGPTQGLIMQRTGAFGRNGNPRLERIDVVTVPVNDPVLTRLQALQPSIDTRYQTLLAQELNYALTVERRRAAA